MDELDLFRSFRRGVELPSADARRRAVARLDGAIGHPRTSWTSVPHATRKRRVRTALASAALAGVVVAALLVSTPWTGSPGFLDRAEAALTPPEGAILHFRNETRNDTGSGCPRIGNETWVDQAPPHRFRAFLTNCVGQTNEFGGVMDTQEVLMLMIPDTLTVPDVVIGIDHDPVAGLREAIRNGQAQHEGTTRLRGRAVERIRIDCPPDAPCAGRPSYLYVDPKTYFPVEQEIPGGCRTPSGRFDCVVRYSMFEYLPRTPANLALTDIRAQHPNATGP